MTMHLEHRGAHAIGRLTVPNFDSLGYTDWRLGVSPVGRSPRWSLQASDTDHNNASQTLTASVSWDF